MKKSLSSEEKETLSFYDARADEFVLHRKRGIKGYWDAELDRFGYYLPSGSVIELGCGGGVEATFLGQKYDYLGTDLSKEFIRIARQSNPELAFETLSLYDIYDIRESYDGLWCCATLMHIPKRNIQTVLTDMRGLVRKGGVGFISIQGGSGEYMEVSNFAPNLPRRLFAYYRSSEFKKLLRAAGFAVIREESKTYPGFAKDRDEVQWLSYYIRAT